MVCRLHHRFAVCVCTRSASQSFWCINFNGEWLMDRIFLFVVLFLVLSCAQTETMELHMRSRAHTDIPALAHSFAFRRRRNQTTKCVDEEHPSRVGSMESNKRRASTDNSIGTEDDASTMWRTTQNIHWLMARNELSPATTAQRCSPLFAWRDFVTANTVVVPNCNASATRLFCSYARAMEIYNV